MVTEDPAQLALPCAAAPFAWTHVVFWIEAAHDRSGELPPDDVTEGIPEQTFNGLVPLGRVLEKRYSAPGVLYAAELTFLTSDDSAAFRCALAHAACDAGMRAYTRNYAVASISLFWRSGRRWRDGGIHEGPVMRFFDTNEPAR